MGGNDRLLEERVTVLTGRVDTLERDHKQHKEDFTTLMVELKVLQTRVSLYAGAIALGTSLASKYLFS